ncbi:DnaD domain protein [Cohnella nanjingensis]|uniref:DnaD domain protein n=1 Tax=Cohnella nanjingensis TaxID=1387779 RepID=A0A7X0RR29_9BACL|nr:DnaD domain protein [Cohnella nanjingensis]MBB6670951.1 DnaD domain protein [Cohnella nanjingensis]
MRVSNRLEFTENHRYTAYRDFALSGLERKVLTHLYQPMVGAFAVGLYLLLYHHLGDDRTGYAPAESQRKLFLGLDLELNAAGRKALIEHASKLEAVGLLQVYRQHDPASEETLYEYVLIRPLAPPEFFANLHLSLLLRDKIGKPALLELRESLVAEQPAGLARFMNREEVTVPFYELFSINPAKIDPELEAALAETAPTREAGKQPALPERIRHSDMLLRFPRGSANRGYVERLGHAPESMAQINYLAYKYDIDIPEISRLLDEDGIFRTDGTLRWDELQARANLIYRQDRKRGEERERYLARTDGTDRAESGNDEAPSESEDAPSSVPPLAVPERFGLSVTVELYNQMLRREPYTRMLERYFPGTVPDAFVRIFERIDLNYKLPEPVINVLIHYVLGMNHSQRLTKSFIDSIATNMLAKGIDTFDKSVLYIGEQEKLNQTLERRRRGEEEPAAAGAKGMGGGSSRSRNGQPRRKPAMPVVEDRGSEPDMSEEELTNMRELARKLKNRN